MKVQTLETISAIVETAARETYFGCPYTVSLTSEGSVRIGIEDPPYDGRPFVIEADTVEEAIAEVREQLKAEPDTQ